jgi:hypothetical protein
MMEVFSYIAIITIFLAGIIPLMALIIHTANENKNSIAKESTRNRRKRFYRKSWEIGYRSFAARGEQNKATSAKL